MKIVLNDGTVISGEMQVYDFGPAVDLSQKVSESLFSENNLSSVTIDGEAQGRMILDFIRPDGLQFWLRHPSEIESEMYALRADLQAQAKEIKELERKVAGDVTLEFDSPDADGLFITTKTLDLMDETDPCVEMTFSDAPVQIFLFNRLDIPDQFYLMNPQGAISDGNGPIRFEINDGTSEYVYQNVHVEDVSPAR